MPPSQLVLSDVTPATRLLDKRRQQFEVDEALDAAKVDYASKEEAFKLREEVGRQCGASNRQYVTVPSQRVRRHRAPADQSRPRTQHPCMCCLCCFPPHPAARRP